LNALTESQLQAMANEAIARWQQTGLDAQQQALLGAARFQVVNLPDGIVGLESPANLRQSNIIQIDDNAGGRGWFIDSTPSDSYDFVFATATNEFIATPGSPAYGRIDLLTVISHELGHVLGLDHPDAAEHSPSVMASELATGVRRLPTAGDLAALNANRRS